MSRPVPSDEQLMQSILSLRQRGLQRSQMPRAITRSYQFDAAQFDRAWDAAIAHETALAAEAERLITAASVAASAEQEQEIATAQSGSRGYGPAAPPVLLEVEL